MTSDKTDLDPIDPSTAQELFLDHKGTDCTEATVDNHRYRLNHFVRWCDKADIDNLNNLTGRDIHRYRLWRKDDGNLNKLSLRMQMSTLRVFLKWAGTIEAVSENLYDKVMVPRVSPEERQRDEILDSEDAEAILHYLSTYEYASTEHVLIALLWQTGIRIGSAHSIDIEDVSIEKELIRLVHRPASGTTLKNGKGGERLIAITPELSELIEAYLNFKRKKITDAYDRKPLFTTTHGRMHPNTIRRLTYRVTSPCYRGEDCPGCKGRDGKCDESVSPHSIRRGSITHYLTNDIPVEIVSDRMNVSRRVLNAHYDKRSEEVKLEQRRGYLDNL